MQGNDKSPQSTRRPGFDDRGYSDATLRSLIKRQPSRVSKGSTTFSSLAQGSSLDEGELLALWRVPVLLRRYPHQQHASQDGNRPQCLEPSHVFAHDRDGQQYRKRGFK